MADKFMPLLEEVKKVIVGKNDVIGKVFMAILAGGHVLLEDIPGVGKTTMALGFSRAMGLEYRRVQFTPDVLPSDIVGFTVYNKSTGRFDYKPGAAMCNILLADEVNRTFSKTQAALLEVMEEGNVTVDGVTYPVPKPFVVIATQNPMGATGTQMLPESQLDRFMIRVEMGYPDTASQIRILKDRAEDNPIDHVRQVLSGGDLLELQHDVAKVYVADPILEYLTVLCEATRGHGNIALGVSPRGVLALHQMARACAYVHGRDYCIPADVQEVFKDVCSHRIVLNSKSRLGNVSVEDVLDSILKQIEPPSIAK